SDFTLIDEALLADVLHSVDADLQQSAAAGKGAQPLKAFARLLSALGNPVSVLMRNPALTLVGTVAILALVISVLVWRANRENSVHNSITTGPSRLESPTSEPATNPTVEAQLANAQRSVASNNAPKPAKASNAKNQSSPELIAKATVKLDL